MGRPGLLQKDAVPAAESIQVEMQDEIWNRVTGGVYIGDDLVRRQSLGSRVEGDLNGVGGNGRSEGRVSQEWE
jgi:hypothetical protein